MSTQNAVKRQFKMVYGVVISVMLASPVLMPSLFQLKNGKLSDASLAFDRIKPMFNLEAIGLELFDGAHFVDSFPVLTACVCTTFLLVAFIMSSQLKRKLFLDCDLGVRVFFYIQSIALLHLA